MSQPPPMMPIGDLRKTAADNIKLLAVFHFILAGFALLGLGFLFLHYTLMHTIMSDPEIWKSQKGNPPPMQLVAMFKWFYLLMAFFIIAGGVANLLSGRFMLKKRNRTFSLVVAGFDCLQFPFGTALGIFTFIILLRDSVREIYDT